MVGFLMRRPDIAASVRSLDLAQDSSREEVTNPEMLFLIFNQLPSLRNLELTDVRVGDNFSDPSIELVVDRHLDHLCINLDDATDCVGSLSRVILSLTDCPYGVREKEPFHKVISRFGKAFPRLRKQGIL
ncbi:hypothetical protein PHLCEN_2v12076 [Hermanssonia centrifuga]|uniref:Uncharacterized protein n=1 Tax=Hermanssonia centrifuga TaxID=98765 RepID=A0A2R6NI30_9APHY|nr:hypothetical protein PHLCEN_2v12076 [Hermanssonia centrifuga]